MKSIIPKKLSYLYWSIQSQSNWYTGLALKKYLRSYLFSDSNISSNRSIESGRFSAYCHFDGKIAFSNLLGKYYLTPTSHVLAHPLLKDEYYDLIKATNAQISQLDCQKETLSFSPKNLSDFLRQQRSKNMLPELIIHYASNGLYREVAQCMKISSEYSIPSLVVIDNSTINEEFYSCYEELALGSMLWVSDNCFIDEQIAEFTQDINNYTWYFSIHIEDRIRSTSETHLKESHTYYSDLLSLYLVLLAEKYRFFSVKTFYIWLLVIFTYREKRKLILSNKSHLSSKYSQIRDFALPDIIFNLEYRFPTISQKIVLEEVLHSGLMRRSKTKRLYDYFAEYIKSHPTSQIEVPTLYLDRDYCEFVFYTDNKQFWIEYFASQKIKVEEFDSGTTYLTNNSVVGVFAKKYGLRVHLESLEK